MNSYGYTEDSPLLLGLLKNLIQIPNWVPGEGISKVASHMNTKDTPLTH